MKKSIVLILSVVVMLGCGGEKAPKGRVEVTFWHAMGGPLGKTLDKLVDEFNQDHQAIFIKSISMGNYQALSQKVMAAIAAGTPPTIAQVYENWTANLIDSRAVVPVERFISSDPGFGREDLDDIFSVFIEGNTFADTLWTFPFNKGLPALYYNREMFQIAGLDPGRPPETWDEFLEYARKLTKDVDGDGNIDQWGTSFSIATAMAIFQSILIQNGGEIMDPGETEARFNSEIGVEALQFMVDLVEQERVAYIASGSYEHQTDFAAGRVAMIQAHIVSRTYMDPQLTFEPGIAPIPQGQIRAAMVTGTNIAIFAGIPEEQQRAGWEFVKWFTQPEQTAAWAQGTSYVPVRRSALEIGVLKEEFERVPGLRETMSQVEYAVSQPQSSEWYEGRKYLEEEGIEAALRGYLAPGEALDRAADKLNQVLREKN